jgi:hypothetical protein
MALDERHEFATCARSGGVRDVAIHTVSYAEPNTAGLVGRMLRGRLSAKRMNAIGVADYAHRSPEEIVAMMRAGTEPHDLTKVSAAGSRSPTA